MTSDEAILSVRDVSKSFGGVVALDRVSFVLPRGSVLGIIGPNGSGKTTLVSAITGFVRSDSGQIHFKGQNITRLPPHEIATGGIARTFQTARPFHRLSALQSLIVPLHSPRARKPTGAGRWGDRNSVAMDLLEEVGFERDSAVPNRSASALPQGYLRRLELARCLALEAELIITDELFSGLSHAEIASTLPLIEKLHLSGVSLILVEHRLRELFQIAQRVLVLEQGSVIARGSADEVASDPQVREAYFGAEM